MKKNETSSFNFLSGGGEMGALMRAYDWNTTSLGSPDTWSATLKTTLRLLLTSNHPMFIFWGPQLLQFYNDAYRVTLGPERHPHSLGKSGKQSWAEVWDIIGPDIELVMSGQGATWHEDQLVPSTRHGKREDIWWTYGFSPIEDDTGVLGVLIICNDVTQQHVQNDALKQLNQTLEERAHTRSAELEQARQQAMQIGIESDKWRRLYETVLSNTPDFVYVIGPDRRFQYANEVLLKMWGHTWESAIGKTFLELGYEPWHAEMHEREIEQVKLTKQPYRGEVPFHGTFGRRIYDYIFAPVFGPDGEVEAVAGTTRDVTDRKDIEDALRKSQAHLSSLFEQSSAGICETDLNAKIINVNERYCQILGRSRDQLIGTNPQDFTYPDDLLHSVPPFNKLITTGESFEIEKRYVRPDGSLIWASTAVSLIHRDGDSAAETILAVVLDITERKKAEEALQEASRRKDEFLAMLAHELRNPLAPIGAAAELLGLAHLDEGRVKQISAIISRQVKHMTELVDDLLDVSRVTSGLVEIEKAQLDVSRIFVDAVEQVRPLIDAKQHRLTVHAPQESVFVLGDQKRLVQVLTNLLNNAAKYTPEGGDIVLRMEVDASQINMTVVDNGIGMTKKLAEQAFELFVQAERTSDRAQGGLGIGLALVKSLTELHGGKVAAHSDGIGQGSRFSISLPRLNEQANLTDADPGSAPQAIVMQRLKVLVVDDNADAADTLAMYFEALGHHVLVEHDSHKALARAKQEAPNVCLLDIGLPEMDGNELARRLRAQIETQKAILVAISGYGQQHDRKKAIDAGFDYHFVKPVDATKLASLLNDVSK